MSTMVMTPPKHRKMKFFKATTPKTKRSKPAWVEPDEDPHPAKKFRANNGKAIPNGNARYTGKLTAQQLATDNAYSKANKQIDAKRQKLDRMMEAFREELEEPTSPAPSTRKERAQDAIQRQRRELPITAGRARLVEAVQGNDVTILVGETGSGKTTQIPQYLFEAGYQSIAVTQPRRVAATSLADRVSKEQGTQLGSRVGYSVRFDERCSPETNIKYVTDGMLVREMLGDAFLEKYSVIIVDEAHERTLRTDILLARLKEIVKARNATAGKGKGKEKPFKVIVMSATLDAEKFSRYFDGARILYVKGRQHQVSIYHASQPQLDYLDAASRTFWQVHTDKPAGDVLIFLPGQDDIESLQKSLELVASRLPVDAMQVSLLPMYAAQQPGATARIFAASPPNTRKCILATNIAETSLTIPGVKYVIDTGKCKEKRFLAATTGGGSGLDTLLTRDISQSSAMQRAGRAGREGPGACFRLYTADDYKALSPAGEPEILRCSLTASLLQLKCLGQDLETLDFIDRPDENALANALKTLWLLEAINNDKHLTPLGRRMAVFPLEPVYARALLAASDHGCTAEVLDVVSVLSASAKLFLDVADARQAIAAEREKFRAGSGDHMTVLAVLRAYDDVWASKKAARRDWCRRHYLNERALMEARDIREQLRRTCEREGVDWRASVPEGPTREDAVVRSMAHGLLQNSALLQPDNTYKQLMGGAAVKIHPASSVVRKEGACYHIR
ncbi:P-loop containing nucleoside triphosphate hydrolase protein [Schizophyllum amplum]|uniref:RNA helicase n=1 Tax=Schizophyllum amplum TaxID=97359 RepID=A0A550C914_9AGAR|nr:P-loop containing nucleoside triphosphate hydrolase protein [Auriculariopsis ampla]